MTDGSWDCQMKAPAAAGICAALSREADTTHAAGQTHLPKDIPGSDRSRHQVSRNRPRGQRFSSERGERFENRFAGACRIPGELP